MVDLTSLSATDSRLDGVGHSADTGAQSVEMVEANVPERAVRDLGDMRGRHRSRPAETIDTLVGLPRPPPERCESRVRAAGSGSSARRAPAPQARIDGPRDHARLLGRECKGLLDEGWDAGLDARERMGDVLTRRRCDDGRLEARRGESFVYRLPDLEPLPAGSVGRGEARVDRPGDLDSPAGAGTVPLTAACAVAD